MKYWTLLILSLTSRAVLGDDWSAEDHTLVHNSNCHDVSDESWRWACWEIHSLITESCCIKWVFSEVLLITVVIVQLGSFPKPGQKEQKGTQYLVIALSLPFSWWAPHFRYTRVVLQCGGKEEVSFPRYMVADRYEIASLLQWNTYMTKNWLKSFSQKLVALE